MNKIRKYVNSLREPEGHFRRSLVDGARNTFIGGVAAGYGVASGGLGYLVALPSLVYGSFSAKFLGDDLGKKNLNSRSRKEKAHLGLSEAIFKLRVEGKLKGIK